MNAKFSLLIEEVFYQYGIFVKGKVQSGSIKTGDKLKVISQNAEMENLCASLEMYVQQEKVSVKEAIKGDYVCIGLLQGSKLQIKKGMKLIAP